MKADLVTLFQALGDRTRLRLLNLLAAGEVCVCYFVDILGETQPKISRHLAYLRRAGLAHARREGKWMHYSLARPSAPAAARVLDATLEVLAGDKQMQHDLAQLERVCCAQKLPPALQHAPKPQLRSE